MKYITKRVQRPEIKILTGYRCEYKLGDGQIFSESDSMFYIEDKETRCVLRTFHKKSLKSVVDTKGTVVWNSTGFQKQKKVTNIVKIVEPTGKHRKDILVIHRLNGKAIQVLDTYKTIEDKDYFHVCCQTNIITIPKSKVTKLITLDRDY